MEDLSQRKLRELAVLDLLERKGALSSMAIAQAFELSPDSMFQGRKIRHIIGDMVYDKLMKRRDEKVKHGNRRLPLYAITDKGREVMLKLQGEIPKGYELAPGVVMPEGSRYGTPQIARIVGTHPDGRIKLEPTRPAYQKPADFDIRKGNSAEVVEIPASRRELRESKIKPLLENKPLKQMAKGNPADKIVPLPEKPKTPPYPALGRPSIAPVTGVPTLVPPTADTEERLKALVASMGNDSGRQAFLEVARVTFENEARLKRIEAALAAFFQVLNPSTPVSPREAV